jgi:Uma2 family endonuclease
MGETDIHRENRTDLIQTLEDHFADEAMLYVSGWLLVYYEEGDPRKRVAPDVFVVRGVERHNRDNYLIWNEGKGLDLIIELTSKRRRRQDKEKFELYRDVLKVPELFLIDPSGGCFNAPLQGFRWSRSDYVPIEPGRGSGLPSEVLGLNLVREGYALRLVDPDTGRKLPTNAERIIEAECQIAEARLKTAQYQFARVSAENEHLRQENEALRENRRLHEELEALRRGLADPA